MKFRCLAEPVIVDVTADNEFDAQNAAFARYVLELNPADIKVWPAKADDIWDLEDR